MYNANTLPIIYSNQYTYYVFARTTVNGARNFNFLELKVSGPALFPIFFLYGYVDGHITFDEFSWTDPLIYIFAILYYVCRKLHTIRIIKHLKFICPSIYKSKNHLPYRYFSVYHITNLSLYLFHNPLYAELL